MDIRLWACLALAFATAVGIWKAPEQAWWMLLICAIAIYNIVR